MLVAVYTFAATALAYPQTLNTMAAPPAGAGPKATLNDVRWLAGSWHGTGLGGTCEEIWSAPAAGAMMGAFRWMSKGSVGFYEFMTLREDSGSLVLQLKHFDGDLTPWEERERWVTFRLARMTATEASFGGLTYRLVDTNTLRVFVALGDETRGGREEAFEFRRQVVAAPGSERK